ncbi:MAG TPA: hypothetical protein VIQ53_06470, partial [Inquilinus sp.]
QIPVQGYTFDWSARREPDADSDFPHFYLDKATKRMAYAPTVYEQLVKQNSPFAQCWTKAADTGNCVASMILSPQFMQTYQDNQVGWHDGIATNLSVRNNSGP